MKFQLRTAATLCAFLLCSSAFSAQIPLPATLDQLLPDGDFAMVGDLKFDNFTYIASGDMPIPAQINVEALNATTIRFTGPFLDLPGGIGNGASDATLGFTVMGPGISEVSLSGNPSLLGGSGSASVTETFAGFPNVKLDIFDQLPPQNNMPLVNADATSLGATVNSLTVVKDILLLTQDPLISATLSVIDQGFTPEPTGLAMALVGFIGLGALRRRRS